MLIYLYIFCITTLFRGGLAAVGDETVDDTGKSVANLLLLNAELRPFLSKLSYTEFFRYYKIDFEKQCKFWSAPMKCTGSDCGVDEHKDTEEDTLRINLGDIEYFDYKPSWSTGETCKASDFSIVDDDPQGNGKYVDLIRNPERFTGYSGEPAHQVWKAVYEENCFPFIFADGGNIERNGYDVNLEGLSIEKRAFYRILSGMQASISTHLCSEYYDEAKDQWISKLDCYKERLGNHPKRIQNLYFLYSLVLQSISKMNQYFERFTYCSGNVTEDVQTKMYLMTTVSKIRLDAPFVPAVDEFFRSNDNLKTQFKAHFRNISEIIDCVACEKCKLWGKIQVSGIGTALKILFSFDPTTNTFTQPGEPFDTPSSTEHASFKHSEISALVNVLHKLSESIEKIEQFKTQKEDIFLHKN